MAEGRLSLIIFEAIARKHSNESRKLYNQWKKAELFSSMFSFFGLVSASVDYEDGFSPLRDHENCLENTYQIYRYYTLIFTLVAIFFLVLRHRKKSVWRNKISYAYYCSSKELNFGKKKNLFSSRLLFEIFILCIFPYPYLKGNFSFMQSLNKEKNERYNNTVILCYNYSEIIYVIMFSRLFFIFRASLNFTPYQNNHASYYCSVYKKKANVRFAIKSMMKSHPFLLIYIFSLSVFVLLGVFLRVFERPFSDVSGYNYESFENSIWNCGITMATVGFGDLAPSTLPGRFIGVLCIMWGGCVFSMIVFSFQKMFQLDKYQKKAFSSIKQSKCAARVISACLSYQMLKKKHGTNSEISKKKFKSVIENLKKFQLTMKNLKKVDEHVEEMNLNHKFSSLSKQINALDKNIDKLIMKYNT